MIIIVSIYFIFSLDRYISFVYHTTALSLFNELARASVLSESGDRRQREERSPQRSNFQIPSEGRSAPNAREIAGGRPRPKVSLPLAKSFLDLFCADVKNNLNDCLRNVHYHRVEENGYPAATENQMENSILSSKG